MKYMCKKKDSSPMKSSTNKPTLHLEAVKAPNRTLKEARSRSIDTHSLKTASSRSLWYHSCNPGNLSSVRISSPRVSWTTSSQNIMFAAMSTNPKLSPPKNFFSFSSLSRVFRCSWISSISPLCSSPLLNATFFAAGQSCIILYSSQDPSEFKIKKGKKK